MPVEKSTIQPIQSENTVVFACKSLEQNILCFFHNSGNDTNFEANGIWLRFNKDRLARLNYVKTIVRCDNDTNVSFYGKLNIASSQQNIKSALLKVNTAILWSVLLTTEAWAGPMTTTTAPCFLLQPTRPHKRYVSPFIYPKMGKIIMVRWVTLLFVVVSLEQIIVTLSLAVCG